MTKSLMSFGIRGITLVSKLVSVVLLARFLSVADYAVFGIAYAFIAYAVYFTSLNFYSYSIRSVLKGDIALKRALYNHLILVMVASAFFIGLFVFVLNFLESIYASYLLYLLLIYVAEQLAHELYHFLIAAQRQISAGVVFFLRVGLWPSCLCLLMYFCEGARDIDVLFIFWALGSIFSVCVAVFCIISSALYNECKAESNIIYFSWIKIGILVAAPLMLSTLLVRGILSFDKIWLLSASNEAVVGAYVLIATIANSLITFLEAGLFSFVYPRLIKFKKDLELNKFRKQLISLSLSSVMFIALFSISFLMFVPYLVVWSGKDEYLEYVWLEYYVLFSVICFALGMVAQYGLYALELDSRILVSHFCGALTFFMGWMLMPTLNGYEVLITVGGAFLVICILKIYYLLRYFLNLYGSKGDVV